jgi:F0F1-type ATP synthase alpha subunit
MIFTEKFGTVTKYVANTNQNFRNNVGLVINMRGHELTSYNAFVTEGAVAILLKRMSTTGTKYVNQPIEHGIKTLGTLQHHQKGQRSI